jgi:hypothetical protein
MDFIESVSTNNLPKEESVEFITLYRSLYILKKKFEKYKKILVKFKIFCQK